MPLHIIAKLTPKPGSEAQLRAAMADMVAPSRAEAGCRQYEPYQSAVTNQILVVETWDDKAALDLHGETPHMKVFRAKIADLLAGPVEIEETQPVL